MYIVCRNSEIDIRVNLSAGATTTPYVGLSPICDVHKVSPPPPLLCLLCCFCLKLTWVICFFFALFSILRFITISF